MAQNFKSIQEAIPQFDRKNIESHIQNGERERQEILKRFPISDWPSLPLENMRLVCHNQQIHSVVGLNSILPT